MLSIMCSAGPPPTPQPAPSHPPSPCPALAFQEDGGGNLKLGPGRRSCHRLRQALGADYPPDLACVMWTNISPSATVLERLLAFFRASRCELLQPIAAQLQSSIAGPSR